MRRVLLACLVATGCYVPPVFEIELAWDTTGVVTDAPASQVGVGVTYFSARWEAPTHDWREGYTGVDTLRVGVDPDAESEPTTTSICANLERRQAAEHRPGCKECGDVEVTWLTMQQCKDVALADEVMHVSFDFRLAP
jgi:hypothetical protein